MRIGHCAQQYPERRNIIARIDGARYTLCRDRYGVQRAIRTRLGVGNEDQPEFLFDDFGLNSVDLFHFFNHISIGKRLLKRPYVVTFETFVPRIPEAFDAWRSRTRVIGDRFLCRGLDSLASDRCSGLVALSKSALQLQEHFLQIYPEYASAILKKTTVIHPPQQSFPLPKERIKSGGFIHFAIVGHAFFRKGGREIMAALETLRERGWNDFRLTIVSKLQHDRYATKTDLEDVRSVRRRIAENSKWITYYESMSQDAIYNLMETVDVGLLPSYAETYGYAALEFQAHGIPVITTDIRAFPEINTEDCGWIIDVPKNQVGEALYQTAEHRGRLSRTIENQLCTVFEEIINNQGLIKEKGGRARERILLSHDPDRHARKLLDVYRI